MYVKLVFFFENLLSDSFNHTIKTTEIHKLHDWSIRKSDDIILLFVFFLAFAFQRALVANFSTRLSNSVIKLHVFA